MSAGEEMKFLLDVPPARYRERAPHFPNLVVGQLFTPLTRYSSVGVPFAIDNGAFTKFDEKAFLSLLERESDRKQECLFVAVPDIVGSAIRTLEVFMGWSWRIEQWPLALVAQDGIEDQPIPWSMISAIFIGGSTQFKESIAAEQCVKAGLALGKHVHIGRVNTVARFMKFQEMGAHTCDGSGVSRFDWMLDAIARGDVADGQKSIFEKDEFNDVEVESGAVS